MSQRVIKLVTGTILKQLGDASKRGLDAVTADKKCGHVIHVPCMMQANLSIRLTPSPRDGSMVVPRWPTSDSFASMLAKNDASSHKRCSFKACKQLSGAVSKDSTLLLCCPRFHSDRDGIRAFAVCHYAGCVTYTVRGFAAKDKVRH